MSKRLSQDDAVFLIDNWTTVRNHVNKILKSRMNKAENIDELVPLSFENNLILGSGMWGVVIGLPDLNEIVIKLTTDPFEYHLTNIIMQDSSLKKHPAIPYTLGTSALNIKNKEFPLYLIVRENLNIGVHMSATNPLKRMEKILIEDFIWPIQEIEKNIASAMNKRNAHALSLLDISLIHSLVSGEIGNQITKIKSKLPKTTKKSKFNNVLDLQKKLLDRGIAFVDITENNLGTRIPGKLSKMFKDVGRRDLESIVVSDLGMAYGTPIFLGSDMGYKNLNEMIDHILGIFGDYGEEESMRHNPSPYLVGDLMDELTESCQVANMSLSNVLLNNESHVIIDNIVSKILDRIPDSRLDSSSISFLIKTRLISVIKHWIDPLCVFDFNDDYMFIRCYVDSKDNEFANCRISQELSLDDESPIGLFEIPISLDITQLFLNFFAKKQIQDNQKKQQKINIPIGFMITMNGVDLTN
jgi:hypothetical protein